MQDFELKDKMRIVQELVPGRQITLLHIIANPDPILYQKLGLDPRLDYSHSAIGVLTVSPAETAVITADISMKTANVELGFVDRRQRQMCIRDSSPDVWRRWNLPFSISRITSGISCTSRSAS